VVNLVMLHGGQSGVSGMVVVHMLRLYVKTGEIPDFGWFGLVIW
jgi:hypothetical protein